MTTIRGSFQQLGGRARPALKTTLTTLALCLLLGACAGQTQRSYLGYSHDAVQRQDWQAAYRLMEDTLCSKDAGLRDEAMRLVKRYPQIRSAAFATFSTEALRESYRRHGERAWLIEKERLSWYQCSIATPEQYAQAEHNYQEVYGQMIAVRDAELREADLARQQHDKPRYAYEQEVAEALAAGRIVGKGSVDQLLQSLSIGELTRHEAVALLGRADLHLESFTILTWPLRVEGRLYTVLPRFVRSKEGVTHSLVLAFDADLILRDRSLVQVVK